MANDRSGTVPRSLIEVTMMGGAGQTELKRISSTLSKLARQVDQARALTAQPTSRADDTAAAPPYSYVLQRPESSLGIAEALFAERRRRDAAFVRRTYLLGEPAWDILLFLYIGKKRRWAVSVTHAARATGAAPTTAIRSVAKLESDGLVYREADPFDRRRLLLHLTDEAAALLEEYMDSLRSQGPRRSGDEAPPDFSSIGRSPRDPDCRE